MSARPIGIFDSGVGGLTVLKKIFELLPGESTVYFGDTARLPYGEKSAQSIIRCSLQNACFLSQHQIKLLVIACHTAASYSTEAIKSQFSFPVIDVIDPGIRAAVFATKTRKIGVLGTRATVQSGVYPRRIRELLPDVEVISVPCPLFVPLVEEGFLSHPATRLIVEEYMRPVRDCDTIVLGCTHYPHLQPVIQEIVGRNVTIIDSAEACAHVIASHCLTENVSNTDQHEMNRHFYVSDDPEKFRRQGERFLGRSLESVALFSAEELSCV